MHRSHRQFARGASTQVKPVERRSDRLNPSILRSNYPLKGKIRERVDTLQGHPSIYNTSILQLFLLHVHHLLFFEYVQYFLFFFPPSFIQVFLIPSTRFLFSSHCDLRYPIFRRNETRRHALANAKARHENEWTCSVPGELTWVSVGIIIGRLMGSFRPGDHGIRVYTARHNSDTLGRGWPVTRFIRGLASICTDKGTRFSPISSPICFANCFLPFLGFVR